MKVFSFIKSIFWNLERFGFFKDRLIALANPDRFNRPVVIISYPKAGTHMVETLLCFIPGIYRILNRTMVNNNKEDEALAVRKINGLKNGQMLVSHFHFSNKIHIALIEKNALVILLKRNLRDRAASNVHYVLKRKDHYLHKKFKELNPDDRFQEMEKALLIDDEKFTQWEALDGINVYNYEIINSSDSYSKLEFISSIYAMLLTDVDNTIPAIMKKRVLAGKDLELSTTYREKK